MATIKIAKFKGHVLPMGKYVAGDNIIIRIRQAMIDMVSTCNTEPKAVYLGQSEYHAFIENLAPYAALPLREDGERDLEFGGARIYQVRSRSHIGVGF